MVHYATLRPKRMAKAQRCAFAIPSFARGTHVALSTLRDAARLDNARW
jgi:hypothetical protein